MARTISQRRPTRQAATAHKRSVYVEPETDDDFDAESDGEADFEPQQSQPPPRKRQKTAIRPKPNTRSRGSAKSTDRPGAVRRVITTVGKPRKPNSHGEANKGKIFTGPSDGKIPAWTSLPLDILREIFIYAAQPLHEQTTTAAANAGWLMRSARTCRGFAVPALEAYYQSPPLLTNLAPHHLLELLNMPSEKRFVDYNVKTKTLQIDVRRLAYTATNRPLFNVSALVAQLPRLQHLEIIHPIDQPPFRPMKVQNWRYPLDLFETLREHDQRLRSWRWNRDMITVDEPSSSLYIDMTRIHLSKPFQSLRSLVVCGFDVSSSAEPLPPEDGSEMVAPGLASSISMLPSLTDLTFISCDVVVDTFLERLPKELERLELTNCLELTSDMLQEYLVSSGSQLRELVLNHNPALTLQFLPGLKATCPKLEVLKMDLRYYSERFNSNDAEPLYDTLLADETPTWPTTLRHLELQHLQKWTGEGAQNLFRSLIDSAENLPDLRHLVLHTHINIPWRDRVGFRDQWIERLERVYLRKYEEPFAYLGSLRQYKLWKQAKSKRPVELTETEDEHLPTRKLSHIAVSPHKPSGDTDVYSDSSPEKAHQPRRSRRVAETQSASPPADSESEDEETDDWRKRPERFIQGRCRVVDVRIDNQRPRENQWTEGDFLDSEVSGDEDWQEGADGDEEEGYAW